MDFTALKQEVSDRGFARLSDPQRGVLVNRACAELDEPADGVFWPYREASVTGTAPLAVTDLAAIEAVFDTTGSDTPVRGAGYRWLVDTFGDLSSTGSCPSYWYLATPAGVPTVATYPVTTAVIGVQYFKTTPLLVAGSDTPLSPERYHGIIASIAVRMALSGKGDYSGAAALQGEIDLRVAGMRTALLYRQVAGPTQVLPMRETSY